MIAKVCGLVGYVPVSIPEWNQILVSEQGIPQNILRYGGYKVKFPNTSGDKKN